MSPPKRQRLGEILVEHNLLLPEQLEAALVRQKQLGHRLGQVLIEMGLISYDAVAEVLSQQTGVPHIWLRKGLVDPKIVEILSREKAEAACVIPMFKIRNTLTLAMADCDAIFVIDDVERLTGCKVQPVQCRREDIEAMSHEHYGMSIELDEYLDDMQETDVQLVEARFEDLRMIEEKAEGAQIINLVNMVILRGIREGTSDIHIEPDVGLSRVRFRIDGNLQEIMTLRTDLHPAIVSRVKVMGRMDIAERRVPQDGRIQIRAERRDVDVRVSSMPTVLGEKIVMRLLDKAEMVLDINQIGMHDETLSAVKDLLRRPNGIVLVTGPTGSGKTTTLYCGLSYINTPNLNIITIEDPVEYQLELINQVQVNEEQGLTFARTLRSVLRQDPDVIMVGEIRDPETSQVSIQAALTGHLVLSTLHTNDSAGAVARLVEMNVEPYLLSSALIGVMAQRLVRKICPNCRTEYLPPDGLLSRIGWENPDTAFAMGAGCEQCYETGLRGRTGIYELLAVDESVRRMILHDPSADAIRKQALEAGMRTLKEEAFRLVENKVTSLEEVMRVVFIEEKAPAPKPEKSQASA